MSGHGVNGGWLRVRGRLRYNRISAGIIDREPDWHFGQTIRTPQKTGISGKMEISNLKNHSTLIG
jgi:hypothetical protein